MGSDLKTESLIKEVVGGQGKGMGGMRTSWFAYEGCVYHLRVY